MEQAGRHVVSGYWSGREAECTHSHGTCVALVRNVWNTVICISLWTVKYMQLCTSGYDLCYVAVGQGIDPRRVQVIILLILFFCDFVRVSVDTGIDPSRVHMSIFIVSFCFRNSSCFSLTYSIARSCFFSSHISTDYNCCLFQSSLRGEGCNDAIWHMSYCAMCVAISFVAMQLCRFVCECGLRLCTAAVHNATWCSGVHRYSYGVCHHLYSVVCTAIRTVCATTSTQPHITPHSYVSSMC